MYTKVLFVIELILSLIVLIFSLLFLENNYRAIFVFLAISIIPKIMTGYYQFISQMTSRFNELSFRNLINSILTILIVVGVYILYKIELFNQLNYYIYIILTLIILYILAIWYIRTYKDISFGKAEKIKENKEEIKNLVSIGFPLLVSNLIGTLILSMDRQFVSILFETQIYGIYSFAYNIITLAMTAVSAVSTVLYPTLKKNDEVEVVGSYDKLMKSMMIIIFALIGGFFILVPIIKLLLPNYIYSINILKIIFPTIAIQAGITLIMHNYYKVFQKTKLIFRQSVFILVLSIVANGLAYIMFKSTESISIASVIVMYIWFIITELGLKKEYKIKTKKNYIYMSLMIIVFYISILFDNNIIGGLIYYTVYLLITILMFLRSFCRKKEEV